MRVLLALTTLMSAISLEQAGDLDLRFSRASPQDQVVISEHGMIISFCPILACVLTPTADHQRTSALFRAETRDDGHSQEQTVAIETIVKTGKIRIWSPNTYFAEGDNVSFAGRNTVYRAVRAGRSSSDGDGPRGKSSDIVDGSVRWSWINDAAISGKVGLYNELAVQKDGGASWGQANNVHLQHGAAPSFNVNTELDFGNEAAECVLGTSNCYNLLVSTGGKYRSTAALYVVSDNRAVYAAHWGIRVAGDYIASDADIEEDGSAPIGLGLGVFSGNSKHGIATILDRSTSEVGVALKGRYHHAQIEGRGFLVDPEGRVTGLSVQTRELSVSPGTPSSNAPCSVGRMQFDEERIYVCVPSGRWKSAILNW